MKYIILLVALSCGAVPIFAQQPPPVGSCSGPSQVGNTATTQNAGGTSSSTYICAAVGQGPVRYVWQLVQPTPTIPMQTPVIPPYAGTGSPAGQPCIANAQVTYGSAIYICGATVAGQYGIAPAGAATSVPIGGVVGNAAGSGTYASGRLTNNSVVTTGTVTNSVQSTQQIINYTVIRATDFGVVCDGSTDNITAVQKAFNALATNVSSNRGYTLQFPSNQKCNWTGPALVLNPTENWKIDLNGSFIQGLGTGAVIKLTPSSVNGQPANIYNGTIENGSNGQRRRKLH